MDTQVNLALAREGGIVSERLDRELESSVYRLVQEALTNVAKHAEAETVWIDVAQDNDLDLDRGPRRRHRLRHGRAPAPASAWWACASASRFAGGSLTIVSTPGVGTVLRGRIPLERPVRGFRRDDLAQA